MYSQQAMKKAIIIFQFCVLGAIGAFAQTGTTNGVTIKDGNAQPEFLSVNDEWKQSLRPDGVIDRVPHRNFVVKHNQIRENDIMWSKRLWRLIDIRQRANEPFRYAGDDESGGGLFIEILIDGIKRGDVQAFDVLDDRFTTKLEYADILGRLSGKPDTLYIPSTTGVDSMVIRKREFDPEKVLNYRVKEDVVFDRVLGRAVTRIIGICPVVDKYDENNEFRGQQPLFWLYYPDLRPTLTKFKVYNPDNDAITSRITWDDYFEQHRFSSFIYKSTLRNNTQQNIRDYKNGVEKIYTSEKNKEFIFNKEQDMWVQ